MFVYLILGFVYLHLAMIVSGLVALKTNKHPELDPCVWLMFGPLIVMAWPVFLVADIVRWARK